jgi:hypothetical protein
LPLRLQTRPGLLVADVAVQPVFGQAIDFGAVFGQPVIAAVAVSIAQRPLQLGFGQAIPRDLSAIEQDDGDLVPVAGVVFGVLRDVARLEIEVEPPGGRGRARSSASRRHTDDSRVLCKA